MSHTNLPQPGPFEEPPSVKPEGWTDAWIYTSGANKGASPPGDPGPSTTPPASNGKPPAIKVGDTVVWRDHEGRDWPPAKVREVYPDQGYCLVEGSDTGLPLDQVRVNSRATPHPSGGNSTGTARDWALTLLARGYWAHAIHPGQKRPIGKSWGVDRWDQGKIDWMWDKYPDAGVGIALGPGRASEDRWLIDLEGDGPQAANSLATIVGGEIPMTPNWPSVRGLHALFVTDGHRLVEALEAAGASEGDGISSGVFKLPELPDLEWRIGGYKEDGSIKQIQSVCPPTPGTDGKPREWIILPDQPVAELPESVFGVLEDIAERKAIRNEGCSSLLNGHAGPPSPDWEIITPPPSSLTAKAPREWTVEERVIAYLAKIEPAVSGEKGHNKTFGAACRVGPGFDLTEEEAFRLINTHYNQRCQPPWSEKELRHKIEDAYKKAKTRGRLLKEKDAIPARAMKIPSQSGGEINKGLAEVFRTDLGNAERLVTRHGATIRYCHPWSKWLVWDGRRWAIDQTGAINRLAKDTVRNILVEASWLTDKNERIEHIKWHLASECRKLIIAMLALAESEKGVPILHNEMNRDGWLFNCNNGTIDLRTGLLRGHRKDDLITQLCPVDFDPSAKCPLWEGTLSLFFADNHELITYWQKVCGYCLVGVIRDHIMPIAHGKGENGKSTILNTLMEMFGRDYAMKCMPDMLMAKKTDTHPTDRADLFGKRLVVAIETEAGRQLNETMVKELTGGDKIRARRMREDPWEFDPTHTLLMATNHRPIIRGGDHGIWRRLKLIPFAVSMKGKKADTSMPEKLRAEFSGILAWCVRGCLRWQQDGLDEPTCVRDATKAYHAEQDRIGAFLEEHTIEGPSCRVKARELYTRYKAWCDQSGEFSVSEVMFSAEMEIREIKKVTSNGKWYLGIGLHQMPSTISGSTS
jgi:P4 family phage/plasmid primase-like protien